jgi:hypothetical protein
VRHISTVLIRLEDAVNAGLRDIGQLEEILERDWGVKLLELLKNIKRFAKNRNYIKSLNFGVHQFSDLL